MPKIPLEVSASGLGGFDKVQQKIKGIANAEKEAAAAATLRVKAQNGSVNGHGPMGGGGGFMPHPSHHPGGNSHHGGFLGSLHRAGRAIGGEAGHMAHRASALGGLASAGPLGIGLAAAGVGLNAFMAACERAAEQVKALAERTEEYENKKFAAHTERGQQGLDAAKDANGIRRLENLGLTDQFKAARAKGFTGSAESFASLGGSQSRLDAVLSAVRLGSGADEAAKMAETLNAKGGYDAGKAGMGIASRLQNRNISAAEYKKSQENQTAGGLTGNLNTVESFQGKTANLGLDRLGNGEAAGLAASEYGRAFDPEGAAIAALQKESEKKAKVLDDMGKAAGFFAEQVKSAAQALGMGNGSYAQQARRERDTNSGAMAAQ